MAEKDQKNPWGDVIWDDARVAQHRQPLQAPENPEVVGPMNDPRNLIIGTSHSRKLVAITPKGEVIFGQEYTPSEAATIFWEHMAARRLAMDDRLLVVQHMEAILVRLGRADMECERLRLLAAQETNPTKKRELTASADLAINALNMVATQAIELGRALVKRPEIPVPAMPIKVPESVRTNEASSYEGVAGLPPEDPKTKPS